MKITVLEKEYNIPEELVNRLKINKRWFNSKDSDNTFVYTSICVIDASALFSLQRWLKDTRWRVNVQLDALSDIKEYAKEATAQRRALIKELREMEKFLLAVHSAADIKLTKVEDIKEMNLFVDKDGKVVVFKDKYYFKYLKEVK